MSNQDQENPALVVNRLAELRKQNNNFKRGGEEEKKEENVPAGSSLVEQQEEVGQINSQSRPDQRQNVDEEMKEEKPNIRAMIKQKYDQMVAEDGENDGPVEIMAPNEMVGTGEIKESIKVGQEQLDELNLKYPNGLGYKPEPYVEPDHDDEFLDITNLVQEYEELREKANFFVCAICTMVVKDPVECSGCQTLFCTRCIEPWRANNDHCPKKCKGNEAVEFGAVHRYIQQEIGGLKFKCANPGCNEVHTYAKAVEHIKKCDRMIQPCIQGCGLGIVGADMTYHCIKQCHFYKITCEKCGLFECFPNRPGGPNKIEDHDCFQMLKDALEKEREKVAKLTKENEELKRGGARVVGQQANEVADDGEAVNARGLKCTQGHDLVVHRGRVSSYMGNPRCDLCQTEDLNTHDYFFRCVICDFDQCAACSAIIRQSD